MEFPLLSAHTFACCPMKGLPEAVVDVELSKKPLCSGSQETETTFLRDAMASQL